MYNISREFEFCYGHRLWKYEGKCSNLHGHNAKVRVTLRNDQLNNQGMLMDFSDIKSHIETWIENHWDHKTLLSKEDPLLELLKSQGVDCVEMDSNPTAEHFARAIYELAKQMNLPVQEVVFWETSKCSARYSDS